MLAQVRMGALSKVSRLSPSDYWLVTRAFLAVGAAWGAVRWFPPAVVLKKVSAQIPLRARHKPQTTARIARAVAAAARYMPASKCLVQAIAGRNLLASCGFSAEIRIGVAKHANNWLTAHAWVEVEGRTLIGGNASGYAPLTGTRQEYRP